MLSAASPPAPAFDHRYPLPSPPPYLPPSCSKKIDWDKFADELKKEEKEETLEGDQVGQTVVCSRIRGGCEHGRRKKEVGRQLQQKRYDGWQPLRLPRINPAAPFNQLPPGNHHHHPGRPS